MIEKVCSHDLKETFFDFDFEFVYQKCYNLYIQLGIYKIITIIITTNVCIIRKY